MPRIITLIFFINLTLFSAISAQIVNGDFEKINSDGTMSNWGRIYLFAVEIDTTGEGHGDSIVFDGFFYHPSTDAHSGNYALELRNAFNYTTGIGIDGGAQSYVDSVFFGFSQLNTLDLEQNPNSLSFYCKYKPVGNDQGLARLILYDENTYELSNTFVAISATGDEYQKITMPINYDAAGKVLYYSLFFSTAISGNEVNLGTRMLIDDVTLDGINKTHESLSNDRNYLFPNPCNLILNVSGDLYPPFNIFDLLGNSVRTANTNTIDVSSLPNGIYLLQSGRSNISHTFSFIKY